MRKINWGLIGFGTVVKSNSNGLPFDFDNSEVYAFYQRNTEEGIKNQKKYNIKKFYSNITDLLSDNDIDAIYICTPPGYHLEYAKLCCDFNKPTYIEKPFARNYLECLDIVNYFNKKGVPIWVAHYKRTLPKFLKIKELLENNAIGKIVNINFTSERPYNSSLSNHKWLYDVELSGGGRFFDIAPHLIDLLIFYFGNFKKIYGLSSNNCNMYKTEDIVSFIFETEGGIIGSANYNFLSDKRLDILNIFGTKGNISFSIEGGGDIKLNTLGKEELISFDEPYIYEKNMVKNIVSELINKKYNTNICHGKDALETYRIIDLILSDFYKGRSREFWKNQ